MKRLLLIVLLAGCGGSVRGAASGGDLDAALDACARGDFPAAEAMLKDGKDPPRSGSARGS
jgi:hypothetical protein